VAAGSFVGASQQAADRWTTMSRLATLSKRTRLPSGVSQMEQPAMQGGAQRRNVLARI
jgi:hypothetical protein